MSVECITGRSLIPFAIVTEASELQREIRLLKGRDVGDLSVAMGVYAAGPFPVSHKNRQR